MRKSLLLLALLLAGCSATDHPKPTPPTPTAAAATPDAMADYSEGVRSYYGNVDLSAADDPNADAEVRYFQPPKPPETTLGKTIRLTGTNIGVQTDVTVDRVDTVQVDGKPYTAVEVTLDNNGLTIYEGELKSATLTFQDGTTAPVASVKAKCSNTFDGSVRLDVDVTRSGCILFEGANAPKTLQLALETVPPEAGGIWHLG